MPLRLVDSGTHGDPKPGEVSKHVKPFDRKQYLPNIAGNVGAGPLDVENGDCGCGLALSDHATMI